MRGGALLNVLPSGYLAGVMALGDTNSIGIGRTLKRFVISATRIRRSVRRSN
jgi:hypothetical protein